MFVHPHCRVCFDCFRYWSTLPQTHVLVLPTSFLRNGKFGDRPSLQPRNRVVPTNLVLPRCQVSRILKVLVIADDISTSNAPGLSLFQVDVPKAHADPYMKCAWSWSQLSVTFDIVYAIDVHVLRTLEPPIYTRVHTTADKTGVYNIQGPEIQKKDLIASKCFLTSTNKAYGRTF